jgi:hypothetical protein
MHSSAPQPTRGRPMATVVLDAVSRWGLTSRLALVPSVPA